MRIRITKTFINWTISWFIALLNHTHFWHSSCDVNVIDAPKAEDRSHFVSFGLFRCWWTSFGFLWIWRKMCGTFTCWIIAFQNLFILFFFVSFYTRTPRESTSCTIENAPFRRLDEFVNKRKWATILDKYTNNWNNVLSKASNGEKSNFLFLGKKAESASIRCDAICERNAIFLPFFCFKN